MIEYISIYLFHDNLMVRYAAYFILCFMICIVAEIGSVKGIKNIPTNIKFAAMTSMIIIVNMMGE